MLDGCIMYVIAIKFKIGSVLVTSGYTKIVGTYELFLFDLSQAEQGINH